MRKRKKLIFACWAGISLSGAASVVKAVEISPLYGLQVLGGQYFFQGQKASLTGNASAHVAPAMKFNENWSLLPSVNSSYQGTKQVVDLVGAGTLFQEQMDHRLAVKGVYTAGQDNRWRLKPVLGFKYQLLKETKDEKWGNGLFDYYRWNMGLEAEYVYHDPFTLYAGVDYFQTSFTNYVSLESQAASTLSRELAGEKVLDTQNFVLNTGADFPLGERFLANGAFRVLYSRFPDQHIVDDIGSLTAPIRQDVVTMLSAGIKMPAELNGDWKLLGSLDASGMYNSSNQNSYDAIQVRYIPFYYNYGEIKVSPGIRAFVGPKDQPIVMGLTGAWTYRRYPYRPIQDDSGAYQSQSIRSTNWMLTSSLTYPMAPHFNLMFNIQYGQANSNQQYEQNYKYSYKATNYLFGFSYAY